MKKETVIAAIVFFAVGFLAGYITDAQLNWSAQKRAASAPHDHSRDEAPGAMPAGGAAGAGMGQGLPEGHPPIDTSAIVKTLEEQAAQNPKDLEPRLKLANVLYDQGQWQKAAEWYQKALELDPRNVNARTDMGTAYFNLADRKTRCWHTPSRLKSIPVTSRRSSIPSLSIWKERTTRPRLRRRGTGSTR